MQGKPAAHAVLLHDCLLLTLAVDPVAVAILEPIVVALDLVAGTTAASIVGVPATSQPVPCR